jgi:hypothetical protein
MFFMHALNACSGRWQFINDHQSSDLVMIIIQSILLEIEL